MWLFVVGPSGSGKTALFIEALRAFGNHRMMGDLTPSTFLSAKLRRNSFLNTCRDNSLLLFKDFTTFLSKRPEDRLAIAAQLREIYDGEWHKDTGEAGAQEWQGRLTIVAGCTPAIERAWAVMRDLGERFMTVRLHTSYTVRPVATAMRKQIGHTGEINTGIRRHVEAIVEGAVGRPCSQVPTYYHNRLDALACMVAQCRCHIVRLDNGAREIIDVGAPELPTRLISAMELIPVASADLSGREPNANDVKLAVRVAIESIPPARWRIIEVLPPGIAITAQDVADITGIPRPTVYYHLDELRAIKVLSSDNTLKEGVLKLHPEFADLRTEALLTL